MWIDAAIDSASGETKTEIGEDKKKIEFYPEIAFKSISISFLQNDDLFQRKEDELNSS